MKTGDEALDIIMSSDVDIFNEEREIMSSGLLVSMWSTNAARDERVVKRQAMHARRHDVPIVVILLPGSPPIPPWLEGAPVILYDDKKALRQLGDDVRLGRPRGKILGPWEA